MITVTMKWDRYSIARAQAAFRRLKDSASDGSEAFTDDVADNVLRASQILVPVETTELKKSGRIDKSKSAFKVIREVKYGGLGTTTNSQGDDWAIFAHEIPPDSGGRWGTGNKHAPPTTYKFLERPATEEFSRADPKLYRHLVSRFEKDWHD